MTTRLISELPVAQPVQNAWLQVMATAAPCSRLNAQQVQQLMDLSGLSLLELAEQLLPIAANFAVVPISGFQVGAIVLDSRNQLYMGANHERTGVPLSHSLHAEQSAIFNALSHGCENISQIVVSAAPCGLCRQFMRELKNSSELKIAFTGSNYSLNELLPYSFGPEDLSVNSKLGEHTGYATSLQECLNMSYAPYSGCRSALLGYMGAELIARGWYIENAAFNPSASPLSVMLSQLYLAGYTLNDLDTIELVTNNSHPVSFETEVQEFCRQLPSVTLKIHPIG